MVTAAGEVHAFGDAKHFGDARGALSGAKAVHIEPTPAGNGYWILDDRGRALTYGSLGGHSPVAPVVSAALLR
jgi:hypothetical protein